MFRRLILGLALLTAGGLTAYGQTVAQAEYFFDTDPGVGLGTQLAFTAPGADSSAQTFSVPISALSQGFHMLGMRVRQAGHWSPTATRSFYKLAAATPTLNSPLTRAEYFFDTDPGQGAATALTVTTAGDSLELAPSVPISALGTGFHTLAVRLRDQAGRWSLANTRVFYKLSGPQSAGRGGRLARAEYYIDTDPGAGMGTRLPAITLGDTVNYLATIPMASLAKGFHTLGVRFADSAGHWGLANTRPFYVLERAGRLGTAAGLARAEYFIDNDPGNGLGRPLLQVRGDTIDRTFYLSAQGLSGGYHTLGMRIVDSAGTYSVTQKRSFLVVAPGVQQCLPAEGGNIGQVTVSVTGYGFTDSTRLRFIPRQGGAALVPHDSLLSQIDGRTLNATLDLAGRDTGSYDLEVTFHGRRDTVITLARAFRIVGGTLPSIRAEIIGYEQMRNHNWVPFALVLQNKGNVDAKAVPVFVVVPPNASVRWNGLRPMLQGYTQQDRDSLGTEFTGIVIDSTLGNGTQPGLMYSFILPQLQAGETRVISFEVYTNPPFAFQYEFRAWALPPMTGPSFFNPSGERTIPGLDSLGNPQELGCLNFATDPCHKAALDAALAAADAALAAVAGPLGGCAYTVLSTKICTAVNLVRNGMSGNDPMSNFAIDYGKGWLETLFDCIDPAILARRYSLVFRAAKKAYEIYNKFALAQPIFEECVPPLTPDDPDNHNSTAVGAVDPNEKLGSTGAGRGRFVTTGLPMRYIIRFENLETATAPALTVTIRDTLDRTVFDPSTIELGFVGFNDKLAVPPRGLRSWMTEIGEFPQKNHTVRVQARYSDTTGVLTWYFQTLNPITLAPLTGAADGFLPPNVTSPEGQGGVFFTINTRPNVPTGSLIRNRASIIFDQNDQILTDPWTNTADATAPQSAVTGLAPQNFPSFNVRWGGTDAGSGIMHYTVYVRTNGGAYRIWKALTDSTFGTFTGQLDSTYSFYSIATDSAGNVETAPASPDATTLVSGIDRQEVEAGLRMGILPNPNTGSFTLSLAGLKGNALLDVLDLQGRRVLQRSLTAAARQQLSLTLPGAPKGLYLVRLKSEQGTLLRRMAVE